MWNSALFWILLVVLLALSISLSTGMAEGFLTYVFVPRWRRHGRWWGPWGWNWGWRRPFRGPWYYVPYVEGFKGEDPSGVLVPHDPSPPEKIEGIEDVPELNGPADYMQGHGREPYTLLNDEFDAFKFPEQISCVNSRSCYATDFDRLQEKTGNYRQLTNNYQRGYPDSCSSPFQELVLSFYKSPGMKVDVPANCM